MAEGDTLINALIGAAINVFGGPIIPFATVLGGAVAGYLEDGSRRDGLTVGALAGVISLVPLVLVGLVVGNLLFLVSVGPADAPYVVGGLGVLVVVLMLFFAVVYTVVFSALGGWLGNYVKYDTDL